MAYAPPPSLVQAIKQTTPDPEFQQVLLATALAESGGRLDAIGDNGNSGGPYQENSYGRGKGIPMPQRFDPVASTQRAYREFSNFRGPDPGVWAARAQRPKDPVGYASKVRALLPEAQRILGTRGAPAAPATAKAAVAPRGGFDPGTMNRIAAYLARSEKAVLAGREVPDIMPLLSKLRFQSMSTRPVGVSAPAPAPSLPLVAGQGSGDYGWSNSLAKQFGLQVTSTYRDPEHNRRIGGSPTSAHMRQGAAADFAGTPAQMRALAEWAIQSGRAKEVFYDPLGYYWDNGQKVRGSIGGHSDHVHITWV